MCDINNNSEMGDTIDDNIKKILEILFLKCVSKLNNEEILLCNNLDTSNIVTLNHCFHGCLNLLSADTCGWDTSKVTSLNSCFENCASLMELNNSKEYDSMDGQVCKLIGDSSFVTDFKDSFNKFKAKFIITHGWDTSNVTDLTGCFKDCLRLELAGIYNWNVSNVINMDKCFYSCKRLNIIDLNKWDTRSLVSMKYMFSECVGLTEVYLNSWDVSKLKSMEGCFSGCISLKYLHLKSWKLPECLVMLECFKDCKKNINYRM